MSLYGFVFFFSYKLKQMAKPPEDWMVELGDLLQKWPQLLT